MKVRIFFPIEKFLLAVVLEASNFPLTRVIEVFQGVTSKQVVVNHLLHETSVTVLNSTLGMHPQSASAKYMGKLTENRLITRGIHSSAVTYGNVIGRSLIPQPGVTG